MSERVSHEKREGNCRIVYFPGTDSQSASLWNHEDCPVCRAERAEQRIRQLERERDEARTRLTFIHLLDSLESDGLSQLGVFFAARAAAKGGKDE